MPLQTTAFLHGTGPIVARCSFSRMSFSRTKAVDYKPSALTIKQPLVPNGVA